MQVDVEWDMLGSANDDEGWDYQRCLYAYVTSRNEIVYIGLAWDATVDQRWIQKRNLWAYLRSVGISECSALPGEVEVIDGRLTRQLLGDVESLLIYAEQPSGNVQCTRTRITRPGMTVRCLGDWPGSSSIYYDV